MFQPLKKFLTLSICLGFSGFAAAQAQAQPAGAMIDIPTFNIVEPWQVQKTPLSQAAKFNDIRLPCVMTAGFDNGFTLRVSGGGGKVMAMAIDFSQEIFRQGRKYNTLITTDDGQYNVDSTAFSESILLFKIKDSSGFYKSIERSAPLIVDVEGNTFRFLISGIEEGMSRLEECFAPAMDAPMAPFPVAAPMVSMDAPTMPALGAVSQPMMAGAPTPLTPAKPNGFTTAPIPPVAPMPSPSLPLAVPAPTTPNTAMASLEPVQSYPEWGDRSRSANIAKATPHDNRSNTKKRSFTGKKDNSLPVKNMDMAIQEMMWSAKDGESIASVINRWGDRANVEVQWQAGEPTPVMGDFEHRGTFNEAVQMLIAQNAAATGLRADMAGMAPAPALKSPASAALAPMAPAVPLVSPRLSSGNMTPRVSPVMPSAPTPIVPGVMPPQDVEFVPFKWSAPSGASLQGVLEFWSKQAGIDFVWQSSHNFELKRGINNTQSYESAIQSVLEQFAMEGIYPQAQLNKDPITGRQTLFVFSNRNG